MNLLSIFHNLTTARSNTGKWPEVSLSVTWELRILDTKNGYLLCIKAQLCENMTRLLNEFSIPSWLSNTMNLIFYLDFVSWSSNQLQNRVRGCGSSRSETKYKPYLHFLPLPKDTTDRAHLFFRRDHRARHDQLKSELCLLKFWIWVLKGGFHIRILWKSHIKY